MKPLVCLTLLVLPASLWLCEARPPQSAAIMDVFRLPMQALQAQPEQSAALFNIIQLPLQSLQLVDDIVQQFFDLASTPNVHNYVFEPLKNVMDTFAKLGNAAHTDYEYQPDRPEKKEDYYRE